MRILYENLIDGLAASRLTVSSEQALYGAVRVQDQRLTTRWRTDSGTAQTILFSGSSDTIVGGNIGLVTGGAATNLVTDPENLTSGNWTAWSAIVTTAESIIGYPAYKIERSASANSYIAQTAIVPTASALSFSIVARYGNAAKSLMRIQDIDAGYIARIDALITWATKSVTYAVGSEAIPPQWIDDTTVRLFAKNTADIIKLNSHTLLVFAEQSQGGQASGQNSIYSAPMLINKPLPVPYVATSRSIVNTSYSHRLPPSGKFIIDCEFFPFFNFDTASDAYVGSWSSGSSYFHIYYITSSDAFIIRWFDGGTFVQLASAVYDNGASFRTLNDRLRLTASIDISDQNQNGSMLFMNGTLDDVTWSIAPDALTTSTFTTLSVGRHSGGGLLDGIFRNFRIYGGVFTSAQSAITTEAEIDAALKDHTLLFDQTYQRQFDFDTVAIMGHNISEGAKITMQANDWDEWNYSDGSGSSIIQHALTWDKKTILKMITKTKKQYVKFTIDDPNNDYLDIGRFWIGPYLDIDPSSLDSFRIKEKRTDNVRYGINRQKFADIGTGYREFTLSYPRTPSAMVTAIDDMYAAVGNHSSVIFCNFDTLRNYQIIEPVYCSIVGDLQFSHRGHQEYEYRLVLSEDK